MNVQKEVLEQSYAEHVHAADEAPTGERALSLQEQALEAMAPNLELGHNQPPFGYGAPIQIFLKTGTIPAGILMLERWQQGGLVVKAYRDTGTSRESYIRHHFIPLENVERIDYTSPFPAAPQATELTAAELQGLN